MSIFDTFLDHVRDAAGDVLGEDADDVFDRAEDLLGAARGGRGDDEGGRDPGDAGDGDGWDLFGRVVDAFSGGGDGDGDALSGALLDRATALLPDELRGAADGLLGPEAAGWVGRLVDPAATEAAGAGGAGGPGEGWSSLGGFARSLGLGEGEGMGDDGWSIDDWSPNRLFDLAGPLTEGLRPYLGADGAAALGQLGDLAERAGLDPRVSEAIERLRPPADDRLPVGDGHPAVLGGPEDGDHALGLDDTYPDDAHPDADADGYAAEPYEPPGHDELVTSGAPAPDPATSGLVTHDPTFPDDPAPAPPPADDFHTAVEEAEQVETSMHDVFEGPS